MRKLWGGNSNPPHVLSNINSDTMTADCAICGPVELVYHTLSKGRRILRCKIKHLESRRLKALRAYHRTKVIGTERYPEGTVCEICGSTEDLVYDHDHSCCDIKQVKSTCGSCFRGWLCRGCNTGLGAFKDDVELLARAIKYLEARKND